MCLLKCHLGFTFNTMAGVEEAMCVIMVASGLEDVKFSGLNFILNNLLCVSLCLSCSFFFFTSTSESFFLNLL